MLSVLGKISSRRHTELLFSIFPENRFDISSRDNRHEMSIPVFWEIGKKYIITLSSSELGQRVVKVNVLHVSVSELCLMFLPMTSHIMAI